MSAPWEALVTIAGGSALSALLILIAGYAVKRLFDRQIKRSEDLHATMLGQNLDTHRALLGFAADERRNVLAQASAFDTDLRERRIPVYTELWRLTRLLPKWPRATGITGHHLRSFSENLRKWYFSGGGMFLSYESVDAYKHLQDELAAFLAGRPSLSESITGPEYDWFRECCSALRTELTNDIVSRRAPPGLSVSPAAADLPG